MTPAIMTSYDNCRNMGRAPASIGCDDGIRGLLMGRQRAVILLEQLAVQLPGRELLVGEGQLAGALPGDGDPE